MTRITWKVPEIKMRPLFGYSTCPCKGIYRVKNGTVVKSIYNSNAYAIATHSKNTNKLHMLSKMVAVKSMPHIPCYRELYLRIIDDLNSVWSLL